MLKKRVLSLGQCNTDHAAISGLLRTQFDADVTAAHTFEDAVARLRQGDFALVLVNRVLDHDGRAGLDFIDQLRQDERLRNMPVMLVSNYQDAQQEAVARGARFGFGKSALRQPDTLDRLRAVLGTGEEEPGGPSV
jgi:two-component system chemotaxis response regulator CheY